MFDNALITYLIMKSFWKNSIATLMESVAKRMEYASLGQVELDIINEVVGGSGLQEEQKKHLYSCGVHFFYLLKARFSK